MKLLQFAVSSLIDGSTGSHQAQRSNSASHAVASQSSQTRSSIGRIIRTTVTSVSNLASRLAVANRKRVQRRKDTMQILQLNDHYLSDIGLTHDDLADLESGQTSLEGLNRVRTEGREYYNLNLKKIGTSKLKQSTLSAANQETGELSSCG